MRFFLMIFIFCFTFSLSAHDEIPALQEDGYILIQEATIHTASIPPVIEGDLLLYKGKILNIAKNIEVTKEMKIINGKNKHIYPGLISPLSSIGLTEINSVRGTKDYSEVGHINPNIRADVAYNPDSEHIPVTRSNGILYAHIIPQGSLICGLSSLMKLDGWSSEECCLKNITGLHIRWPHMRLPHNTKKQKKEKKSPEKIRDSKILKIKNSFEKANAYLNAKKNKSFFPIDLRWEALSKTIKKEVPVFIHANDIVDIKESLAWAIEQQLKPILVGGAEAYLAIDLIKDHNIPVIIDKVLKKPHRLGHPYEQAYSLAQVLYENEILFAISAGASGFGVMSQRNLPYEAAMAMCFGLSSEQALKSITLYPAKIFGVDDKIGSLEVGKDASFIICDGDIFEIPTQVEMAFIEGKKIDLNNRHKRLEKKYRIKYQRLGLIDK